MTQAAIKALNAMRNNILDDAFFRRQAATEAREKAERQSADALALEGQAAEHAAAIAELGGTVDLWEDPDTRAEKRKLREEKEAGR